MLSNYFLKGLFLVVLTFTFSILAVAAPNKSKIIQKPISVNALNKVVVSSSPAPVAPKIINPFKAPNNPLFSGLQIFLKDGDLLQTPAGVEVVISNGVIDYYSQGFQKHFEIIRGIPQINEKEYANDFMRTLLKPFNDKIKLIVTGNANLTISPSDIRKKNLKEIGSSINGKSYWVPIQNGKILMILETTPQLINYDGGLLKFVDGAKQ